ncbi:unnamed protein product [Cuscuta campestris]|uniref:DYW domain-containing protein n=1 Tax=Cuscuta campestris TaxID=132261 RepID=A0A484K210_9ASTE|nr:unnamed protein product [Cuscuta campestris]
MDVPIHILSPTSCLSSLSNPAAAKSQNFRPIRAAKTSAKPTKTSSIKAASWKGNLREALASLGVLTSQGNPISTCLDEHYSLAIELCAAQRELSCGKQIHAHFLKSKWVHDAVFLNTKLVCMYGKCGSAEDAGKVFDRMPERTIFTWNAIVGAYVNNGEPLRALKVYEEMRALGVPPDAHTFPCALKACVEIGDLSCGSEIHGLALKLGFTSNIFVVNSLVDIGSFKSLHRIADSWFESKYIYSCGYFTGLQGAIHWDIWHRGRKPDCVSLMSVLSASGRLGDLLHGKETHAFALKRGLDGELQIGNTLVDMYAKCGQIDYMDRAFRRILHKDNISWTTVISAYAQSCYYPLQALQLFREVQLEGIDIDALMIGSVLLACGELRLNLVAEQVHGYSIRRGLYDLVTQKTLIRVYGDCGNIEYSRRIFVMIGVKDVVSLTSMMRSFVHNGLANDALALVLYMKEVGMELDYVAVLSMISAATSLSVLRRGREVHGYLIRKGYPLKGSIASSLLDMYACCGTLEDSFKIFSAVNERDLVLWTSMINSYGMHGRGVEAIGLFLKMEEENIVPDHITFLVLLHACSHSALVEEGKMVFETMERKYNLEPWPEHYACLVDLLGRANHLQEAFQVLRTMKPEPTAAVWCALLHACHVHSNKELGVIAAKKLLELEPENPGNYVLVSNLYASGNRWDDAEEVRTTMKGQGMKKEPACSWTEIGNEVHTFVAQDKSHPRRDEIYQKLSFVTKKLEREGGYVAQTKHVFQNVEEREKVRLLNGHSERLAIACALLVTDSKTQIRIMKNLRVCGDCHNFIKLASKVLDREIIVRDAKRFHHFRNGACSCGDFW